MCMHVYMCESKTDSGSLYLEECYESLKMIVFHKLCEKRSHRRPQLKKYIVRWQIESFILGLGGYSCATYFRLRHSGNTKRGWCNSSASDSTFMHLYYKKCASSSKLTVMSKVLEVQLGICLSGLALFTCWVLFFFFFWVCFSLVVVVVGWHSGMFLEKVGEKERVFVSSILVIGE